MVTLRYDPLYFCMVQYGNNLPENTAKPLPTHVLYAVSVFVIGVYYLILLVLPSRGSFLEHGLSRLLAGPLQKDWAHVRDT